MNGGSSWRDQPLRTHTQFEQSVGRTEYVDERRISSDSVSAALAPFGYCRVTHTSTPSDNRTTKTRLLQSGIGVIRSCDLNQIFRVKKVRDASRALCMNIPLNNVAAVTSRLVCHVYGAPLDSFNIYEARWKRSSREGLFRNACDISCVTC